MEPLDQIEKSKKAQSNHSIQENQYKIQAVENIEQEKSSQILDKYPIKIIYCSNCGLPLQYCPFGSKKVFQQCKEQLVKQYPAQYAQLYGQESTQQSKKQKEENQCAPKSILVKDQQEKKKQQPQKKVAFNLKAQIAGKKGQKVQGQIKVSKLKRGGKKFVTTVQGLQFYGNIIDHYSQFFQIGIDLKQAAKSMRKKFACGTSVEDKMITIQGGMLSEVQQFILSSYKMISLEKIQLVEDGGKKKKK